MTRISDRFRYETSNQRLNNVRSHADGVNETLISGKKLRKLSDDPAGAVRVFRNRTKLGNIQQYRKTLDFARGFLAKTEDAILSINESLIRAKELAVQQSNSTWDAENRAIVSEEVKQIADHISTLGNSTYGDKYVFGGFQTSQPPIGHDGTFSGDDGVIFVQVDEDSFRPINITGRDVFEVAPDKEGKDKPLIGIIRGLVTALRTNSTDGIHDAMNHIDKAISRMTAVTAVLGARRNGVEDVARRLELSEEQLMTDTMNVEDADTVQTALDMRRAESAVQTTLTASGKLLTPSLMNFIQ